MIRDQINLKVYENESSLKYPTKNPDKALQNARIGEIWRVFNELFKKTKYFKNDFYKALAFIDRFFIKFGFYANEQVIYKPEIYTYFKTEFNKFNQHIPTYTKRDPSTARKLDTVSDTFFKEAKVSLISYRKNEDNLKNYFRDPHTFWNKSIINGMWKIGNVNLSIDMCKVNGIKYPSFDILLVDNSGKNKSICFTKDNWKSELEQLGFTYGYSLDWGGAVDATKDYQKYLQVIENSINDSMKNYQTRIFYSEEYIYLLNRLNDLIYSAIKTIKSVTNSLPTLTFGIDNNDNIIFEWK